METKNMSYKPYFSSYGAFKSFLEETDGTTEYYYLSKEKTGLNVDLYIDDCLSYKRHRHLLWLYICDGYSHNDRLIPISVSANPMIEIEDYDIRISQIDITGIRSFIIENLEAIQNIANEIIDSITFSNSIAMHNNNKLGESN